MAKLKKVPGALVWFRGDVYVITERYARYYPPWQGGSKWDIITIRPITGQEELLVHVCQVRLLKEPTDGA